MVGRCLAFVFFAASAAYLYSATAFNLGTLSAPKAGFVPLLAGSGAVLLTGINFIQTWRTADGEDIGELNLPKAMLFAAGLAGYVALMGFVGFLPATLVATLFMLKVARNPGWLMPALVSAGVSAGLTVVFGTLLQVQLP